MIIIVKHTSAGALLLMMIPLLFWVSGWNWYPEGDYHWLKGLYWLTQTVTLPWVILTSTLLIVWFLWRLRYRLRPGLRFMVILFTTLFIGQGIKFFIKDRVQEPRPYVVWLNKYYTLKNQKFYTMPPKIRTAVMTKWLQQQQLIPPWLQRHWCVETSFSFPSGHTVFAASWALLAIGLLWPRQYRISTIVLMGWASGVMVSRIFLGMHWPRDVVMGIGISWLSTTLACWLVQYSIDTLISVQEKL